MAPWGLTLGLQEEQEWRDLLTLGPSARVSGQERAFPGPPGWPPLGEEAEMRPQGPWPLRHLAGRVGEQVGASLLSSRHGWGSWAWLARGRSDSFSGPG